MLKPGRSSYVRPFNGRQPSCHRQPSRVSRQFECAAVDRRIEKRTIEACHPKEARMRRRHLLALSAGALAAPALITQPARAAVETRELHGWRIRAFAARPGSGLHDVACNADGTVWI